MSTTGVLKRAAHAARFLPPGADGIALVLSPALCAKRYPAEADSAIAGQLVFCDLCELLRLERNRSFAIGSRIQDARYEMRPHTAKAWSGICAQEPHDIIVLPVCLNAHADSSQRGESYDALTGRLGPGEFPLAGIEAIFILLAHAVMPTRDHPLNCIGYVGGRLSANSNAELGAMFYQDHDGLRAASVNVQHMDIRSHGFMTGWVPEAGIPEDGET